MDDIIYELSAESLTNRKYQTSLVRRESEIRKRKGYSIKKHDLSTIARAKEAVNDMSDAAAAYRDFCLEMTAARQEEEGVMRRFAKLRDEFKEKEKAFVKSAKEMVLVNERFCESSQLPARAKMCLTEEWLVLREDVLGHYGENDEAVGSDAL